MAGITPMLSSTSLQYKNALDRIAGPPQFRWFSWTQPGCGSPCSPDQCSASASASASARASSRSRRVQVLNIFVRAAWCSGKFRTRSHEETRSVESSTAIEKRVLTHYSSARKDFDILERLTISETSSVGFISRDDVVSTDQRDSEEEIWTINDSAELYKIDGWGAPYFFINSKGHVSVHLHGHLDGSDELDLVDLIESLRRRNLQLPMVLRFPEIVQHRIRQLNDCFNNAIAKFSYQRHFQGVFPIKCNHDRYLLEDIVKFGDRCKFGLEAGSKPELLIAIAKLRGSKDALLICNGYKDRVYIESVLLARQLGVNAIIVLEQMEELEMVIQACRILGVRPMVGVRAKLSTKHTGHWGGSSGDKGKFGLTVTEIVRVVYTLRKEGMLDCLQLLHFHIGSQIPSISIIKEAMREGSHIFCELALMGAPMQYIDVGGGLGIDYDGSKTQSSASTNYSMQNYANDVVAALVDACILKGVAQPVIISESGRALASHHSVLVFDVLSTFERSENTSLANLEVLMNNSPYGQLKDNGRGCCANSNCPPCSASPAADQDPGEYLLHTFEKVYNTMDESNFRESYSDAKQFKSEISSLFKLGCLSLEQRAQADALYEALCHRVVALCKGEDLPDELQELRDSLAAVYHINLSVFRSAPDAWAIDQIFPIIPLQRLTEKPTVQATLADLTCDSDGKFDRFIGENGEVAAALPVHELRKGEPYLMGLFLGGVYQEVMGSAHNLFGGTNIIHVKIKPQTSSDILTSAAALLKNGSSSGRGGYTIERVIRGQTMEEVMRAVQHVGDEMTEELRREAEDAVAKGHLSVEEAQALLVNYKRSLGSYTYLSR
ncbi:uncharacterized protein LOC9632306 [Selaginella moellendorffii]|uniref:uncharacterized protein LOC9632306 n=1 Tax=Selaginella moellendorffii TaxID=88036 RepID=UPI000D1C3536|nr:uncharacterized protein LOC9632306 [Selaginella moellendorffii]|eukprot:XP_024527755.1 uncharacterized protein LOC9632306 [Selaginella moellendorffii]